MDETEEFEEELTTFVHDLFLNPEYVEWRKRLKEYEPSRWYSLIAELSNLDIPLNYIINFGEATYSKLVFNYCKAPDYQESQMLMVQFTVSGSMWHSLVWHCPDRN